MKNHPLLDAMVPNGSGGGGGGGAPDWRATLPEDLRANPSLSTVPDVATLAKNYVNQASLIGTKRLEAPSDKWTPDKWKEFNSAIGVPESPDKYGDVDAKLIEESGVDAETIKAARQKMHEAGMRPAQVKALLDDWFLPTSAAGRKQQMEAKQIEQAKAKEVLAKEYGDKLQAKMEMARAYVKAEGGEELVKLMETDDSFGSNPALLRLIIKEASRHQEDSARGGSSSNGAGNRASVQAEINQMMEKRIKDPAFNAAFNDPKSSERQQWKALHDRLNTV